MKKILYNATFVNFESNTAKTYLPSGLKVYNLLD